jgi:hypothetical protein
MDPNKTASIKEIGKNLSLTYRMSSKVIKHQFLVKVAKVLIVH